MRSHELTRHRDWSCARYSRHGHTYLAIVAETSGPTSDWRTAIPDLPAYDSWIDLSGRATAGGGAPPNDSTALLLLH